MHPNLFSPRKLQQAKHCRHGFDVTVALASLEQPLIVRRSRFRSRSTFMVLLRLLG
jgi:hypothetical protein